MPFWWVVSYFARIQMLSYHLILFHIKVSMEMNSKLCRALIVLWSEETTCSVESLPSLCRLTIWQATILFHWEFQGQSLTVTTPNFRCSNVYFVLPLDPVITYTSWFQWKLRLCSWRVNCSLCGYSLLNSPSPSSSTSF